MWNDTLRSEREGSKRKSWRQEQAEPHLRGEQGLTNVKSTRQNYYFLSQLYTDWSRLFIGFYPHKEPSQLWRGKNSGELIYSCIVKMDISFLTCLLFFSSSFFLLPENQPWFSNWRRNSEQPQTWNNLIQARITYVFLLTF